MSELPADWEKAAVRSFLTPESHQKSKAQFEATHIPIDRIKADYLFPLSDADEFVSQEEFRDAILQSKLEDDNRIFILQGETGSGKSQLCQWLEYQIGRAPTEGVSEQHVALHVSRSKTSLSDILTILTEPLDEEVNVNDVGSLDPEKVAEAIITTLDAFSSTRNGVDTDDFHQLLSDRDGIDLRSILIQNIREYQQSTISDENEQKFDLLSASEYRNLAVAAFGSTRGGDTLFPALRSEIHRILSSNLGVADFKKQLEDLSSMYAEQGLRPVLICEDLTTFTVLKEQLLDHIFQLDSGHLDVVLGWTTGWEKDELGRALGTTSNTYTYMQDRAEGYLSMTDKNGQAHFLDEDVTVELSRSYVSTIRDHSTVATDTEIPEDAFDGLYPFNATFVKQAYNHLIQDGNERRTPRLLLIRIIRECLNSTQPPHAAIDKNPYVKQFPTPLKLEYAAQYQDLAKWYGYPEGDNFIKVRREIFDTFGIPVPESATVFERDGARWVQFEGKGNTALQRTVKIHINGDERTPGAVVPITATVDGRSQAGIPIKMNGKRIGETDEDGSTTATLPDGPSQVTFSAEFDRARDATTIPVGKRYLNLIRRGEDDPSPGEEIQLQVHLHEDVGESDSREPLNGVSVLMNGQQIGTTDETGIITHTVPDQSSVTYIVRHDDLEATHTFDIDDQTRTFPVDSVTYSSDEIAQREFEYEQWLSTGEEYPSSETLREGAAAVLERWHEPTRLGNGNASTSGVNGIYYRKGGGISISIAGADERDGLSALLKHGTEYDPLYKPMFWCGISETNDLPPTTNFAALRAWADDAVTTFRQEMRTEIEAHLPDGMTIETFILFAQYLLKNAGLGVTSFDREHIFKKFETKDREYTNPIEKRLDSTSGLREAYLNLTKSSEAIKSLAEGFFLLKDTVVDIDRLKTAQEDLTENVETYLTMADKIDAENLTPRYRIGTTSSDTSKRLNTLFERVKEYALALNQFTTSDITYIGEELTPVRRWHDSSHTVETLQTHYEQLIEALGYADIAKKTEWSSVETLFTNDQKIRFRSFGETLKQFESIESTTGVERISLLHTFEQSIDEEPGWKIYNAIDEIIGRFSELTTTEDSQFRDTVRNLDEMRENRQLRNSIATDMEER
jgi:hypothetical protein